MRTAEEESCTKEKTTEEEQCVKRESLCKQSGRRAEERNAMKGDKTTGQNCVKTSNATICIFDLNNLREGLSIEEERGGMDGILLEEQDVVKRGCALRATFI